MNANVCGVLLVVLLLYSPETSNGQGFYGPYFGRGRGFYGRGGGFYGRGRGFGPGRGRFGGRGVGKAFLQGVAFAGGAILVTSLLTNRRFRRSVDMESNPYEEALQSFDLAFELDDDMCLEKTLCDVMATSEAQKNPSTLTKVLKAIYTGNMPLLGVEGHEEATQLLVAGLLGKAAKTEEVCRIAFKTCKENPETLKKNLQRAYDKYSDKQ